jgi:hypothetical protein
MVGVTSTKTMVEPPGRSVAGSAGCDGRREFGCRVLDGEEITVASGRDETVGAAATRVSGVTGGVSGLPLNFEAAVQAASQLGRPLRERGCRQLQVCQS